MLLRKWELPMAAEPGEVEQMLETATVAWLHGCDCAEPRFLLLILNYRHRLRIASWQCSRASKMQTVLLVF